MRVCVPCEGLAMTTGCVLGGMNPLDAPIRFCEADLDVRLRRVLMMILD